MAAEDYMNNRRQTLIKYVVPAMLTNVCYFLFTIVDGLFAFWQVVDMILLSEKTVLCIASFL